MLLPPTSPLKNMLVFGRGCGLKILGIEAGAKEYG